MRKIDFATPGWKWPAWRWVSRHHAWPFQTEYLSGLFDYNVAPFFQSFLKVRVESSAQRVRVQAYGVHGRLRWRDLSRSAALNAAVGDGDDFVEWVLPMR